MDTFVRKSESEERSTVSGVARKWRASDRAEETEILFTQLIEELRSTSAPRCEQALHTFAQNEIPIPRTAEAITLTLPTLPTSALPAAAACVLSLCARNSNDFDAHQLLNRMGALREEFVPLLYQEALSRKKVDVVRSILSICMRSQSICYKQCRASVVLDIVQCPLPFLSSDIVPFLIREELPRFCIHTDSDAWFVAQLIGGLLRAYKIPSADVTTLTAVLSEALLSLSLCGKSVAQILTTLRLVLQRHAVQRSSAMAMILGAAMLAYPANTIRLQLIKLLALCIPHMEDSAIPFLILPLSSVVGLSCPQLQADGEQLFSVVMKRYDASLTPYSKVEFNVRCKGGVVETMKTCMDFLSCLNETGSWNTFLRSLMTSFPSGDEIQSCSFTASTLYCFLLAPTLFMRMDAAPFSRAFASTWISAFIRSLPAAFSSSLVPLGILFLHHPKLPDNADRIVGIRTALALARSHENGLRTMIRVLKPLGEDRVLQPTYIQLLANLSASHLKIRPLCLHAIRCGANSESEEVRLSSAIAINKLSLECPHTAIDSISVLSALLSAEGQNAAIISTGLEALINLCEADFIEVSTAWEVIKGNQKNDARPLVRAQVCRLLSLTAPISATLSSKDQQLRKVDASVAFEEASDEEDDTEEWLKGIIDFLWHCCNDSSSKVRSEAVRALACFAQHSTDMLQSLPKRKLADLLGSNTGDNAEPLVSALMELELTTNRKATTAIVSAIPPPYNQILQLSPSISEAFQRRSSLSMIPGLAMASLYCFMPPPPDKDPATARGLLLVQARAFRRLTMDLMTDLRHPDRNLRLCALYGWMRYGRAAAAAFISAEEAKLKAKANVEEEEEGAEVSPHLYEACQIAIKSLKDTVMEQMEVSPSAGSNALLAFAAAALAVPPVMADMLEVMLDDLFELLGKESLERWACVAAVGVCGSAFRTGQVARIGVVVDTLMSILLQESTHGTSNDEDASFFAGVSIALLLTTFNDRSAVDNSVDSACERLISFHALHDNVSEATLNGICMVLSQGSQYASKDVLIQCYSTVRSMIPSTALVQGDNRISCAPIALSAVAARCYRLDLITADALLSCCRHLANIVEESAWPDQFRAHCACGLGSMIHHAAIEVVKFPKNELCHFIRAIQGLVHMESSLLQCGGLIGIANLLGANLLCPYAQSTLAESLSTVTPPQLLMDDPVTNALLTSAGQLLLQVYMGNDTEPSLRRWAAVCAGSLSRPFSAFGHESSHGIEQLNVDSLSRTVATFVLSPAEEETLTEGQRDEEIRPGNVDKGSITPAALRQLSAALRTFSLLPSRRLPRIGWMSSLRFGMKGLYGKEAQAAAARFALAHQTVGSISHLLIGCLDPPVFGTLQQDVQALLLRNIGRICAHAATATATRLLDELKTYVFRQESRLLRECFFEGLSASLEQSTSSMLGERATAVVMDTIIAAACSLPPVLVECSGESTPAQHAFNLTSIERDVVLDRGVVRMLHHLTPAVSRLPDTLLHSLLNLELNEENSSPLSFMANVFVLRLELVLYSPSAYKTLLMPTRNWLFSTPFLLVDSLLPVMMDIVGQLSDFVSLEDWMLDALNAAEVCPHPLSAVAMAECIAMYSACRPIEMLWQLPGGVSPLPLGDTQSVSWQRRWLSGDSAVFGEVRSSNENHDKELPLTRIMTLSSALPFAFLSICENRTAEFRSMVLQKLRRLGTISRKMERGQLLPSPIIDSIERTLDRFFYLYGE